MAKYRLTKNPRKSVNCEILQENLNGYIVRFDNGMVKNVRKSSVYALDKIDEAMLDDFIGGLKNVGRKVKDFGKKVYDKVRGFLTNLTNFGGVVVFDDGENTLNVSHPVNAMKASLEYAGVGFYPSDSVLMMCNELGIKQETGEEDFVDAPYMGSLHYNLMKNDNNGVRESYIRKYGKVKGNRLYEAIDQSKYGATPEDKIRIYLEIGDKLIDSDQDYIIDNLLMQWHGLYTGNRRKDASMPINIILGAPGVGKSAIVEGMKSTVKEAYDILDPFGNKDSINVITINASSITNEAFTLPATTGESVKYYKYKPDSEIKRELRIERDNTIEVIKDLPKTWLPVYDRTEITDDPYGDFADDDITKEVYLNALANGGYVYEDENGIKKLYNGPGGIFFIDEYFRMQSFAKDSLMTISTSRTIGQNLKFGDRWLVVAASNRYSDMSTSALREAFKAEAADNLRLNMYNYVPSVVKWLEFAKKINKYGRPNIMEDITDFVSEKTKGGTTYEYFYEVFKPNAHEIDTVTARVCPRSWEMLSEAYADCMSVSDGILNFTDMLVDDNVSFSPVRKQTTEQKKEYLEKTAAGIIGSEAAIVFVDWLSDRIALITDNITLDLYNCGPTGSALQPDSVMYVNNTLKRSTPDKFVSVFRNAMIPCLKSSIQPINIDFNRLKNIVDCLYYVVSAYMTDKKTQNVNYGVYSDIMASFDHTWPAQLMDLETRETIKAYTDSLESQGTMADAMKAARVAAKRFNK